MKRTIIKIDEDLCDGCGLCVSGCHEGALQIIDGKARLISDLFCDGLGACIGECPLEAITLHEREAEPYDEIAVMERMVDKGENTIIAHLNHLIDFNEMAYVNQGLQWLEDNNIKIDKSKLNIKKTNDMKPQSKAFSGCPGAAQHDFKTPKPAGENASGTNKASELKQWPVQLHLVNPNASFLKNADLLLAADCVAFAMGNFHSDYLKNKSLAIACPKLDTNKEVYIEKLVSMIDEAQINTLTVMIMEVPCCSGLAQMAQMASEKATRKVPVKLVNVALDGTINEEKWL